jgi:hypothetical protein
LAAEVPDVEVEVLVRYGFDVEPDCGDRGNYLTDLILLLAIHLSSSKQSVFCPLVPPLSVMWGGGEVECALFWLKGICTFSLYSSVVLPALSSPRISIRVSFFAQINPENLEM